jgi:hypothetical protein
MTPETAVAIGDYVNAFFLTPLFVILIPVLITFMVHSIWRDWQLDKKERQQQKES